MACPPRRNAMRELFVAALGMLVAAPAAAQTAHGRSTEKATMEKPTLVRADALKWMPAPAAFPAGAQVAALEGDPPKEGPFTMRIKVPKGWRIMPHYHPNIEHLTILQGAAKMGMGDT